MQIILVHNDFLYTITLDFFKILQSWEFYPFNYGNSLYKTFLYSLISLMTIWKQTAKTWQKQIERAEKKNGTA